MTVIQKMIETTMDPMIERACRDEAMLRQSLQDADVVPALMVLAQLTNETALLEEAAPYIEGAWSYQQKIPPALADRIRERLIDVLREYAQTGQAVPRVVPDERLQRIMSVGAGQEVPASYVPLLIEEMRLAHEDPRAVPWRDSRPPEAVKDFQVVVIGAGLSGICAGIRLRQAGIPFVILEKNHEMVGTWFENDYPGCGVDTPNHFYSFSFNPKNDWSHHFAKRDEIFEYFRDTADLHDLRRDVRFGVEVTRLSYEQQTGRWSIDIRREDGAMETLGAHAVISAVGILNRPALPDIDGLKEFTGPCFHTARWDHEVDLKGKRVAMIGTGASAMQAGPEIAPDVAKLTLFQRSPHWAAHNPNYHKPVSAGQQWALENVPLFTEWSRFLLFWAGSDGFHDTLQVDPDWTQPELSLNRENHAMREALIAHIRRELDGDEALIAKCVPSYPPYGKRMLRDNHWYRTLRRPNVELENRPIERISEGAILMRDGTRHEVDVIVLATGFHAGKVLWPMEITGRDGLRLADAWEGDNPRAYKGMTMPGFPNLFVVCGPNTALAHGGSLVFHTECQVKYIMQALRAMLENGWQAIEVREDVHDRYNDEIDERCRGMVWSHPGVSSWYKNRDNRVTITSPWKLVDYWQLTREFEPEDYLTTPAA